MDVNEACEVIQLAEEIFTHLVIVAESEEVEGDMFSLKDPVEEAEKLAEKSFTYAKAFAYRKDQFLAENDLI